MRFLLLLLLALPAQSQSLLPQNWKAQGSSTWGGIDALRDSSLIDDSDAQDAANVMTENGYLEKRPGNTRIATILNGYGVKLVREWVAPSETRYLIAHSSDAIFRTDLSGSVVEVSTVTHGQDVSTTAAFSKLFVADGDNPLWYWDGTSTASVAGAPICNLIEFANERIYCANIPSESGSEVRVSSFGSFGYWTVPPDASVVGDAPNEFSFQKDDGESITCMKATPWGMFIGKRHSTHILKGFDNLTYYIRVIDPNIGCVDNRTVQIVNGQVVWLGLDGIYSFNGTGQPVLLTRNLDPLIKQIRQLNSAAAQWIIDITPDWQSGLVSDAGRSWDNQSVPGSIILSSATFYDTSTTTFYQGTFTNTTSYADATTANVSEAISSNIVIGGDFPLSNTNWSCDYSASGGPDADHECGPAVSTTVAAFVPTVTYAHVGVLCTNFLSGTNDGHLLFNILDGSGNKIGSSPYGLNGPGSNIISTGVFSLADISTGVFKVQFYMVDVAGKNLYLNETQLTNTGGNIVLHAARADYGSGGFDGHGGGGDCDLTNFNGRIHTFWFINDIRISSYQPTGTFVSRTFDTNVSTPAFCPVSEPISSNSIAGITFKEQTSRDGSSWTSASLSQGSRPVSQNRYWRYEADFTTTSATTTATIHGFASAASPLVAIETGTWDSPVHFIGNQISAWKQFNTTILGDNGVQYYDRASTNSFTQSSSTPAWSAQANNTSISIATGTFYQFRIDSSSVTSSTQTEQVDRVAINWQEGGNFPMASGYLNRRYFLCVELSTTAATNDTCLMMQRNGKWVKWSGPSIGALGIYNTDLVMGSAGTDSNVWKVMQDGVYDDDGQPINSYWITKDFTGNVVFNNKVLHEGWLDAQSPVVSSMTFSYAPDKTNNWVDKQIPIDGSNLEANKRVPLDDGYSRSKYFRFKFSDDTSTDSFRLNDYLIYTEDLGRTTE